MSVIRSNYPLSVKIGDFCNVQRDCEIGERTVICSHVNMYGCKVGTDSVIGAFVELQRDCIIGNNTHVSSHSFVCSNVTIGNDVFVGHAVNFTNDKFENGEVHYDKKDWQNTIVEDEVKIGSNSTILPVKLGKGCVIGAGSVVTTDIPEYCVAYGNPAKVKYCLKDKL